MPKLTARDTLLTTITSMSTKANREQFLADVQKALTPFHLDYEITRYSSREFVVIAASPRLRAMFDCDAVTDDHPMIHWHRAYRPLTGVQGAWKEEDINTVHRSKATSFPATFNHMILMLRNGFKAAENGSAFSV